MNTNTAITVYADGAYAIGETQDRPRYWHHLESQSGAPRAVVVAVIDGTDHAIGELIDDGIAALARARR